MALTGFIVYQESPILVVKGRFRVEGLGFRV